MIVYVNSDGTIQEVMPENLTQGSNNQYLIVFGANITSYTTLNAVFKLPNEQVLAPIMMTKYDSNYVLNNEIVNVWYTRIERPVTNFPGTLELTLNEIDVNGIITNSYIGAVQIAPSDEPVFPEITQSAEEIFNQISEAYAYIQGRLAEKQDRYDENLQTTSKEVVGAINELNSKETQNAGDIAELRNDVDNLEAELEVAKTDIQTNKTNITVLQNEVTGIKANYSTKAEVEVVKTNVQTNANNISNNSGEINSIKTNYATKQYVNDLYAELSIGKNKSYVFDTKQQFLNWLAGSYIRPDGALPSELIIGDVILLKEQGVPDYWVSSISSPMTIDNFTEYEVKIDFSDYATLEQLNELVNRVTQVETRLTAVEGSLSADETRLSAVESGLTQAQGDIEQLQASVTELTPDVARALKTPMVAPATIKIVGVNTTNDQEMIGIGNNLYIEDGILNATGGGGEGGTSDYLDLSNKPQINGVTLTGNKTSEDLGLITENDLPNVIRLI